MQLFKTGYQYIFVCEQINISLNEWVNIYHECWTIFTAFQRKKTPWNTFILIIFHVQEIGDEKKRRNLQLMPLYECVLLSLVEIVQLINPGWIRIYFHYFALPSLGKNMTFTVIKLYSFVINIFVPNIGWKFYKFTSTLLSPLNKNKGVTPLKWAWPLISTTSSPFIQLCCGW